MDQFHEVMNLVIKGVISPIQIFLPNGPAYPVNSTFPRLVIGSHFVVAQFISKFRIFYESIPRKNGVTLKKVLKLQNLYVEFPEF